MLDERGETPRPPEVPEKAPESGATPPVLPKPEAETSVPKPDSLLDKLQSEATRTIGAGKSGQSGSSHT